MAVDCVLTSIQGQISEITKLLEDARHAVPDFGPEKARIEADVRSLDVCQ